MDAAANIFLYNPVLPSSSTNISRPICYNNDITAPLHSHYMTHFQTTEGQMVFTIKAIILGQAAEAWTIPSESIHLYCIWSMLKINLNTKISSPELNRPRQIQSLSYGTGSCCLLLYDENSTIILPDTFESHEFPVEWVKFGLINGVKKIVK